MTKREYEEDLNDLGPPEWDHPDGGGRVPRGAVEHYGRWLRRHDPIAFEVGYQEADREETFRCEQATP